MRRPCKHTLHISRDDADYIVDAVLLPLDPPEDWELEVTAVWRNDRGRKGLLVHLELSSLELDQLLVRACENEEDNRRAAEEDAADARKER